MLSYLLKIKIFNHPGIDAKGIMRAVVNNLKNISQNKRLEGVDNNSTNSKKFLLTNEVSLKRKIKEAILAFRIGELTQRREF